MQHNEEKESKTFSTNLKENEKMIKDCLGDSPDVRITRFKIKISNKGEIDALLIDIDDLIDEEAKRNNVLKPFIEN